MRSPQLAAVVVVSALASCGRLDFGARVPDATGGDGGATDSSDGSAACTLGAFGAPVALASLDSTFTDYGGQISADGLALYFDSDRTGDQDLYVGHRAQVTDDFSAPERLAELSTPSTEADPSATADELDLIFDSSRNSLLCLYESTRASATAAWGPALLLSTLCDQNSSSGPYLTPDGLTLYFQQGNDTNNEGQLVVTQRPARDQPFGAIEPLTGLTGGPDAGYAALTADQLTIYFEQASTTSTGGPTVIHQASRPTPGGAFGATTSTPGITVGSNDGDPSITADGRIFAFSANVAGDNDLYTMTRSCE